MGRGFMKSGPVQITRMTIGDLNQALARADGAKRSQRFPSQLDLANLTKYVSESVTVEPGEAPPNCVTCGACCEVYSIVPITMAESERVGQYMEVTADQEPDVVIDRLVKRDLETGRCSHLQGPIGRDIGCDIYQDRPNVCRVFEAGSDKCHEIRRMYGLEPQLSEEKISLFKSLVKPRPPDLITNSASSLASVSISMKRSVEEPGTFVSKRSVTMKIIVELGGDDDNCIRLHEYDPDAETWLQSEFLGMTLDDAKEMIASRLGNGTVTEISKDLRIGGEDAQ